MQPNREPCRLAIAGDYIVTANHAGDVILSSRIMARVDSLAAAESLVHYFNALAEVAEGVASGEVPTDATR